VPEDDSHKWSISVITSPGCAACNKLQADWKTSTYLLAFANPEDAKQSWAHYRVYRSDDVPQGWRWKAIRIASYPTILVQPPRNRRYGDPATVVMQVTGYDGDAKQLATAMSSAIRKYVEIADHFRRAPLPSFPAARCVAVANTPVYAAEHLQELRVLTSVLTLTFRLWR